MEVSINSEPQCICSCQGNSHKLFDAGSHEVRQCNNCSQVFVTGVDLQTVQADYDESHYFLERNSYLERWEELSGHFQKIINTVKKIKSKGTLLDVGCSVGILLDVAQKNGFEVKGVEISRWASEFARERGLDVVTGGLIEAGYPERNFDIIVLNHVVEHLSSPGAILQEAKRILKDDGLLVVGVPNFGSYMAQIRKGKWVSLMPDHHIWQFTHATLTNLLTACGFCEVYFEAKDNHGTGFSPYGLLVKLINCFAVITNNSEAMLAIANKNRQEISYDGEASTSRWR